MAKTCGRLFLLSVDVASTMTEVGGFVTNSLDQTDPAVEVTDKQSGGEAEYLPGCGTRTRDISGDGIASTDSAFLELESAFENRTLIAAELDDGNGRKWAGNLQIENLNFSGGEGEAYQFSMTAHFSGTVTKTAAS